MPTANSWRPCFLLVFVTSCCLLWGATVAGLAAHAEEAPSYTQAVRPILSDHCFACHGPDPETREAGLRLDQPEAALADLGGYAAFVPGKPDESEALIRMKAEEPVDRMPPPEAHKPLTAEQIATVEAWVAAGAPFETHWAYQPLQRPAVPDLPRRAGKAPRENPIDAFIDRRLEEEGLEPAATADRATLIRRLYLDLLGVPPRPQEVAAFVEDDAEDAWRHVVERVLQDTRYGERMAVFWLDLVRYADTIGYHSDNPVEVSAYRDYVIDAFNDNKPYDQFTIEQLAGDLLPEATIEQKVASGYNRLLQTTQEGGAQAKEYRAIYAADRVRNVSEVWLGSTMGCAQCHDHKYDPFTARDFYSMAAFFADIDERAIGQRKANLKVPTAAEQQAIERLQEKIAEHHIPVRLAHDEALAARVEAGQRAWEAEALADPEPTWRSPDVGEATASGGVVLERQADESFFAAGERPATTNLIFELTAETPIRALRVEAMVDPRLANGRLSPANGNFVLTDVRIFRGDQELAVARAEADFQQEGYPVAHAIDDDPATGWAVAGHQQSGIPRTAMFVLQEPVSELPEGTPLRVELHHQSGFGQHFIGRVRLAVTSRADPTLDGESGLPDEVVAALRVAPEDRSPDQQASLATYYQSIAPELAGARERLAQWEQELKELQGQVRTMLVTEARAEPRMTRILPRGNWMDDSGEIVEPAVPEFLPGEPPATRRATRLDLARWLVAEANPLTARTFVNRVWKIAMGRGLSPNLNDLGGQGQPPTHPELLDWLAAEFRANGWDVKGLVRQIVTSQAYQRRSQPTPEQLRLDRQNRWYARQGRWRVEAEFVRDTVLQISDLLVDEQVGGRSVKPYQPAGYWKHLNFPRRSWQPAEGAALYRRSLYTFWCRSFLHPSMLAFDAPSREECTAERPRSNIPQQALVLLNDPIFVEAARVFGERIARQEGELERQIRWACREAWQREARQEEVALLKTLWRQQHARYAGEKESAQALLEIGEAPQPTDLDPTSLAAWTQVARALISSYETTSRH